VAGLDSALPSHATHPSPCQVHYPLPSPLKCGALQPLPQPLAHPTIPPIEVRLHKQKRRPPGLHLSPFSHLGRRWRLQNLVTTTLMPSSAPISKVLPLRRATVPIVSTT
jgi:hypothetical protein